MSSETISNVAAVTPPLPIVHAEDVYEYAKGVWIIPDHRIPLVPNIGIVEGDDTVLVVDTGMGPENGDRVLKAAQRIAKGRPLIVTLTHFHPEHGYGCQVFRKHATIFYNRAQRDDLVNKGMAYLDMFRGFGPGVKDALEGTELVMPHIIYDGETAEIDLGGRRVELRTWGKAHSSGDQVVYLPVEGILFTGDLVEERAFPIFPWFPPDDVTIDAARWVDAFNAMIKMAPKTVVPGHGDLGTTEMIADIRDYMHKIKAEVGKRVKAGAARDDIVKELAPSIKGQYPDWHFPEWIDFAIRYYIDNAK